jgi:glycerol-1-phosphate dehydrogenase [NAD(P)+]
MKKQPPPPATFQYDPQDMAALDRKIRGWADYPALPEIRLKTVLVEPDAILELPRMLRELKTNDPQQVLLVMDQVPMRREDQSLKPMVIGLLKQAGYWVKVVELAGDEHGMVHPDFEAVETVKNQITTDMMVVTVGSGVITDVTKHACFLYEQEEQAQLSLIFCQTSNSVPAHASGMAVISKDGVKRTWPSRLLDMIIADVKTLSDSPLDHILGGVGDTSPLFSAFADWYLGDYFKMSNYLQASRDILADVNDLLLPYTAEIGQHTPTGMAVLAKIVTLVGLSMTYARESSPMSGYEHVTSHMLDMCAPHYGRPTASHGTQVGVATILHLIGFNWLLDELDPTQVDIERCYPTFEEMETRVKATFVELDPSGAMGAECWNDYRQKLQKWHQARPQFEAFLADWPTQKAHLQQLSLRAEDYVEAYQAAGHPLYSEELNVPVPESQARWAYHNAHLMRKRFSHGDLLFYLGWFDESWTDRVFARMHTLVDKARKDSHRLIRSVLNLTRSRVLSLCSR